jgi:hypothetical protein
MPGPKAKCRQDEYMRDVDDAARWRIVFSVPPHLGSPYQPASRRCGGTRETRRR